MNLYMCVQKQNSTFTIDVMELKKMIPITEAIDEKSGLYKREASFIQREEGNVRFSLTQEVEQVWQCQSEKSEKYKPPNAFKMERQKRRQFSSNGFSILSKEQGKFIFSAEGVI